jgi:hypothetical protein
MEFPFEEDSSKMKTTRWRTLNKVQVRFPRLLVKLVRCTRRLFERYEWQRNINNVINFLYLNSRSSRTEIEDKKTFSCLIFGAYLR